jgi:DNA repair protein RadD
MFSPRPYQEAGLQSLHRHVCTKDTNPCVVIPTGGGKSAMIAWAIQRWHQEYPAFRAIILAHRKELIEQNSGEMGNIYGGCDIGIYSAALGRRDVDSPILFGSIDSVFRRAGEFPAWDVIMVDEAHRIPFNGEGKYRRFIKESSRLRGGGRKPIVVGWTATPFRMNGGNICHKDHILQEVCYEAGVSELIGDGYLSPLRSKAGEVKPDLEGVRKSGGEYVVKHLAERANDVVAKTMAELIPILGAENRRSIVFFCVDVQHCNLVSQYLRHCGVNAPAVTAKTPPEDRDRIVREFKEGKIHGVCNVNVYTEGFNAKRVDCIVLLRPTLSPGLYSQMVGRGLRTRPGKQDCLVLDFAGCIEEHGPIDTLGGDPVVLAVCDKCREHFSRAIGECPICGWKLPKRVVNRLEAAEAEKRMHGFKASKKSILSRPEVRRVDAVFVARHTKRDYTESTALRVSYRTGKSLVTEIIDPAGEGAVGEAGRKWLRDRNFITRTASRIGDLASDMFTSQRIKEWTRTITVRRGKQRNTIIGYNQELGDEVITSEHSA